MEPRAEALAPSNLASAWTNGGLVALFPIARIHLGCERRFILELGGQWAG